MRYLCLIYDDESLLARMAPEQGQAFMDAHMASAQAVIASGQMVASEALHPVHTATTVRIRNGQLSTTDGPFAETREQLGGFYLVEARDLNEAIQIAARIPSAATGCVEVRPVIDWSKPDAAAAAMKQSWQDANASQPT